MSVSPPGSIINNRDLVTKHDQQLFELPSLIIEGHDAPARFSLGPLFHYGTNSRKNFDKAHKVSLAVVFKIYTNNANMVAPMPPNVTNGRCIVGPKAKVVVLKTFNNGDPIELKICLFGKSLNNLKKLCAKLCEQYAPMIQHLLLTRELALDLIWKGVVGRTKIVLAGHQGWFEFVDLFDKYNTKKGSIMILNVNEDLLAKKSAEVSAARKLIASTAGPEPGSQELEAAHTCIAAADKLVRLHKTTARIYHHNAEQASGGNGVILMAPWDGTFHYCLTLGAASVWEQAVEEQITTVYMAPDISAYRAEMIKSRVFHRSMRVDDQVQQRLATRWAKPESKCQPLVKKEPVSSSKCAQSPSKKAFHPMPKVEGDTSLPCAHYATGISKGNNFWIEEEAPLSDTLDTSDGIEDINTRMGLAKAGVELWSDLIPSVQMTEGHLVMQGIDRNVAGKLLARAQACQLKMMPSPDI
ncbi:hypothetical protein DFH28DRAFT_1121255 [Melampsora americana]|nr:hypothetical protein DFH28DRAFT_1121255 [Melampsora americana]